MKSIWMIAALASLAACAGRGEDDMGAAPDRGDTTAVTTGVDTTTIDTLNTGGMVTDTSTSNVEPTVPTTPTDTAGESGAYPSDTETTPPSADSTSVPSADPGMSPDTSSVPSDPTLPSDTGVPSDSAAVNPTDSAATPQ